LGYVTRPKGVPLGTSPDYPTLWGLCELHTTYRIIICHASTSPTAPNPTGFPWNISKPMRTRGTAGRVATSPAPGTCMWPCGRKILVLKPEARSTLINIYHITTATYANSTKVAVPKSWCFRKETIEITSIIYNSTTAGCAITGRVLSIEANILKI